MNAAGTRATATDNPSSGTTSAVNGFSPRDTSKKTLNLPSPKGKDRKTIPNSRKPAELGQPCHHQTQGLRRRPRTTRAVATDSPFIKM